MSGLELYVASGSGFPNRSTHQASPELRLCVHVELHRVRCLATSMKEMVCRENRKYLRHSCSWVSGSGMEMPLKYELVENIIMCLGVRSPGQEREGESVRCMYIYTERREGGARGWG